MSSQMIQDQMNGGVFSTLPEIRSDTKDTFRPFVLDVSVKTYLRE